MGYKERDYYRTDEYAFGGNQFATSMTVRLIIVNVAVYLISFVLSKGDFNLMSDWLAVSGETLIKPQLWWQFLTAGFAHDPNKVQHILFNMIGLFFFGTRIEQKLGSYEYLRVYLVAILLGNVAFAIRALSMGSLGPCLGASGGVVAMIVLTAIYYPRDIAYIYGIIAVPLWLLGIIVVALDVIGNWYGTDNTAHDVHFAGALFACLYGFTSMNLRWLALPRKLTQWLQSFSRNRAIQRSGFQVHREEDDEEPYYKQPFSFASRDQKEEEPEPPANNPTHQAELDRLLQKISVSGIDSLTAKERATLDDHSRRMRQKLR